jgi:hypothetical protein
MSFLRALTLTAYTALAVFGVIIMFDLMQVGVFHDGRCGREEWRFPLLWWDLGEHEYDEFGISERWEKAHAWTCMPIWIRGQLGPDASGFWPRLHFDVAVGVSIDRLEKSIARADRRKVLATDYLGRTLLHWAVIYPHAKGRQRLIDLLVKRGLRMDAKDKEGLTPADWKWRSEHSHSATSKRL